MTNCLWTVEFLFLAYSNTRMAMSLCFPDLICNTVTVYWVIFSLYLILDLSSPYKTTAATKMHLQQLREVIILTIYCRTKMDLKIYHLLKYLVLLMCMIRQSWRNVHFLQAHNRHFSRLLLIIAWVLYHPCLGPIWCVLRDQNSRHVIMSLKYLYFA